ncbi:hypothetical protein [Acinetobacter kyonggiensis]|uniref:Uncharacterized protein n=1 Tax=Acinetobacter kyonggiensis TaxID=595670 RepID=A0A1H3L8I0_9GAMM|nr:hypothetical protein [Acinetobacter kyonggiensis]SDY60185.1 hypothetical protein SAMN05421643_11636 [Acinetobacter kyonggiensis]
MSELKEKYIQFCCDFYNEHAPEDKLWFGRMYDECLQEHNKRNSTMYRWQFPLMILKDQEAKIKELKAQLNNMEQCYIQLKQEHNELIAFNTEIDRKQKVAEKTAEKYKSKVSMIADLLRDPLDIEMTLKAITTVIRQVGEW